MEYTAGRPWYLKLHWQVLTAMLLGVGVGLLFKENAGWALGWIGDLFMRLLRMIIHPLVFASIVTGVASIASGRAVGRLFSKTLGYYLLTSFLAASTGLLMVNLLRPGDNANMEEADQANRDLASLDDRGIGEILMEIVPSNFFEGLASGSMLQIIFFSIVFGMAVASLPDAAVKQKLTGFFDAFFQAMVKLTGTIIKFIPIAVLALIASMVGETGFDRFEPLARYFVTVLSGLSIHFVITLPLVLWLLGRIKPWVHLANMRNPLVLAFSTSSSAATLPVTMRAVEDRVGVSKKVSSFVLPMGATVNMDGTAVFECVGALFIAQVLGIEIGFGQQVIAVFTALLASIGAAAVPSAGLVIIFIVLEAIGLQGDQVNAIVLTMLAIDRPLDMVRTAVNVYSDSCGAAIIARSEGEEGVDAEIR